MPKRRWDRSIPTSLPLGWKCQSGRTPAVKVDHRSAPCVLDLPAADPGFARLIRFATVVGKRLISASADRSSVTNHVAELHV